MGTTNYELLYDSQGAFIGLRENQTTHSPAGLAALAGQLRQAQAERDGLHLAMIVITEQSDRLAAWIKRHAQHPPTCRATRGEGPCDCGLDALR